MSGHSDGPRRGVRRRAASLLVAAGVVAALVVPSPWSAPVALAQDPRPPAEELEQARHHYDEAVAEEAALLDAYEAATRAVAELRGRAAELDAALAQATAAVEAAEAELERIADQLRRARARERRLVAALRAARDRLLASAVEAYVHGNRDVRLASAVLDAGTLEQLQFATTYARAVLEDEQAAVDDYRRWQAAADAATAEVGAARARQRATRDDLATRTAALSAARAELGAAQAAAEQEAARQASLAAEAESRKEAYRQRVAELEAESARIEAELRRRAEEARRRAAATTTTTRPASSGGGTGGGGTGGGGTGGGGSATTAPPAAGTVELAWPISPVKITSRYGWRVHPIHGLSRFHAGIDLDADLGDPVTAAERGTVVWAKDCGGYGNCVLVDHGDLGGDGKHIATLYAHLSSMRVRTGASVARGDLVGGAGTTGTSTGVHLHFEVRVEGEPVDPLLYLP